MWGMTNEINGVQVSKIGIYMCIDDPLNIYKTNQAIDSKDILLSIQECRGVPTETLGKIKSMFGENQIISDLNRLFSIIEKLADKYNIKLQLDPSFQPHFKLYTGTISIIRH